MTLFPGKKLHLVFCLALIGQGHLKASPPVTLEKQSPAPDLPRPDFNHPLLQAFKDVPLSDHIHMYDFRGTEQEVSGHFSIANPKAPKGGVIRQVVPGSEFDTLNFLTPKGVKPPLLASLTGEQLMYRAPDKPFSLCGRLARAIQILPDRSAMIVHLDPRARFHNGDPVTTKEVLWTFNEMKMYAGPGRQRAHAATKPSVIDEHTIRFDFTREKGEPWDQELPLLVLMMHVIHPKSLEEGKKFNETGLTPLITTGPYIIEKREGGRFISYKKQQNYWGKDLPTVQGLYNPDRVIVEVVNQEDSALQALLKGESDLFSENNIKRWNRGYTGSQMRQKNIRKVAWKHRYPVGMHGVAFHQKNPFLADVRIRKALILAVEPQDFSSLMGKEAGITSSFFQNSIFQATGAPSLEEQHIIDRLPTKVDLTRLDHPWDIKGPQRITLARKLLEEAGCTLKGGKLFHQNKPVVLKFIALNPEDMTVGQILATKYKRFLGIELRIQMADGAQAMQIFNTGDYDATIYTWRVSESPGAEQCLYWHSSSIGKMGSRNYAAIHNPNIDALCQEVRKSQNYKELTLNMRVLDRVLLSEYTILPLFYKAYEFLAFSKKIGTPPFTDNTAYSPPFETFWVLPEFQK